MSGLNGVHTAAWEQLEVENERALKNADKKKTGADLRAQQMAGEKDKHLEEMLAQLKQAETQE